MRINVKAKNTQVTEPLTDYINKRFSKLEKYFVDADLAGTVTLIVEKGIHRVEATIPLNRYILRAGKFLLGLHKTARYRLGCAGHP
ncbi:MAG: ribosome-associated translation inhibitor RaiA [Peptococcaceae bacterium]|nr:ribosome-associated translation inhibitor RaiA [Peptococcaceae bacterium]